jgi:hypothetical protein
MELGGVLLPGIFVWVKGCEEELSFALKYAAWILEYAYLLGKWRAGFFLFFWAELTGNCFYRLIILF